MVNLIVFIVMFEVLLVFFHYKVTHQIYNDIIIIQNFRQSSIVQHNIAAIIPSCTSSDDYWSLSASSFFVLFVVIPTPCRLHTGAKTEIKIKIKIKIKKRLRVRTVL